MPTCAFFHLQGNEGIDIKEGSKYNIVENNYCTGQRDPESACENQLEKAYPLRKSSAKEPCAVLDKFA